MMHQKGIFYTLECDDGDGWYSGFKLCDSDFYKTPPIEMKPKWIKGGTWSHFTPLIIVSEYYDDVKRIIEYLLESSPDGYVMFQSRYQGGDEEVICGVIHVDTFFEMLNERKIMFNTCYILTKNVLDEDLLEVTFDDDDTEDESAEDDTE